MYAVITVFGYIVATLYCPHFTMEQCEETLLLMDEPAKLQAKNYCSQTRPPTDKLPEEVKAALNAYAIQQRNKNETDR